MYRRFPPSWTVELIPGGLVVRDANGQSLAYVYSREKPEDAHMAKALTEDEARRIAWSIAKLPELLGPNSVKDEGAVLIRGHLVSGQRGYTAPRALPAKPR
jgi:hypothetical protein